MSDKRRVIELLDEIEELNTEYENENERTNKLRSEYEEAKDDLEALKGDLQGKRDELDSLIDTLTAGAVDEEEYSVPTSRTYSYDY